MPDGKFSQTSQPVFKQIAEQLRNAIFAGSISPGDSLLEERLEERFQVGPEPIRDALQQLVQEEILDAKADNGCYVVNSMHKLVIAIRRMIEVFALRVSYSRFREEDFRRWEQILTRLAEACRQRDYEQIANLDIEFHEAIIRLANLPLLDTIWMAHVARIRLHFLATQSNYLEPMAIYAEHEAMLQSFRAGGLDTAVRMLEDNID